MYYGFSLVGASVLYLITATIGISHIPIIIEEIIRYCNIKFPGNTVYATGLLMVGYSTIGSILSAVVGIFFDQTYNKTLWTIVAG